jgi:fructose-bisphosphate aldolase class 1
MSDDSGSGNRESSDELNTIDSGFAGLNQECRASARLNAMNVKFKSRLPWALTFSFARAIQQPALELWKGHQANVLAAQQALYHRARCNQAARRGAYSAEMEKR